MSVTFDVSKFDKSKLVNTSQLKNMEPMLVTFDVLKLVTSMLRKAWQQLNIPLICKLPIFKFGRFRSLECNKEAHKL